MSALPTIPPPAQADRRPNLRLARSRMSCEVARSIDSLGHLKAEWDDLAESTGCSIYQTYDWCNRWWKHYGVRREPRVFIMRDGNDLLGVVPMFIDRVQLGPVHLRLAKIMGADFTSAVCDLPIREGWTDLAFNEVLQRLIIDDRCDAIRFGPISETSPRLEGVRTAARHRTDLVTVLRDRIIAQHADFQLPETFAAYMTGLSKNARKSVRKARRRLDRDFKVDVEVVTEPETASAEFDEFVRMHADQWRRSGKLGHFGDWPQAERFHRELASDMSRAGRLRLLKFSADDCVVARHYAYVFNRRCQWLLTARRMEQKWAQYGLGKASLMSLIEHVISEGVETLDACMGHYDYKTRLKATEHSVSSILLVANQPGPRSRAKLFCRLADALDRVYYRLWYCRIAPRLPGRKRSLLKTWIRSRV